MIPDLTATPGVIRAEGPGDAHAISAVHEAAFPTPAEARLVERLRDHGRLALSLLAEHQHTIIGHIAFSSVTVGATADDGGLGLAPLAVTPAFQGSGVGARLVAAGLAQARARRVAFVVVLGEPSYYARFGFLPASRWGLTDEYGGGAAFQALELVPGGIPGSGGLVRYAVEFAQPDDDSAG